VVEKLSPHEMRSLLGAYALGAVDGHEARAVEEGVLDDHDARAELHALQLGASWLAATDPRPSAHVWAGIAAELEDDAGGEVVELRRVRSPLRRVLAVAAAVVVAIALGAGIVTSIGTGSANEAAYLLKDDAGRVQLAAVVHSDGTGTVRDIALPPLSGRTYQLWAITDEGPRSAAVLGPMPTTHTFRVPDGASALAVSTEPRGGSSRPTGPIVAGGPIAST
jgi:anti-sigma-K factor RskA